MKLRKAIGSLLGVLTLVGGATFAPNASAAEVIKIGTLAPGASPWGKVFRVWADAVKTKSGDKVELQFFYNGQQGDEGAMVGKMKSGQLDGAAVTAVGLSKIYKPILALQMPGLFTTWAKLDAARDAMKGDFEKGVSNAGFTLVGWGDVGQAHLMSNGFAIKTPDDLRGKKPYMWRDDMVAPVLFQVVGGVSPVPLSVPEVLPSLNTGAVNVVTAPSLAAEQLQWTSKLDHINEEVAGSAIGAVVLSSKRLDGLPGDLRAIVLDTGKIAASALTKRIRSEDAASFGRLKGKMTVVTSDAARWEGIFKQVRQRLAQGTFSPDIVSKLESLAR
jgi:TRAP-type C4-dicarboxylate transport system substrate-binding protein